MKTNKTFISKILDDGGPFVIWEKVKKGEFKRGMILDTWVCDNPECRYLHIQAIAIDERFKEMRFKGEKFIYTLESDGNKKVEPPPNQRLTASVHIDSSKVSISEGTPQEKQDQELFAWLTKEIKGNLFEAMKRRWRMAKKVNRDQWRKMDWSWWEDGLMVGWDEVFPDDLDFVFYFSGKRYWVRDLYCINPRCPCKDVALSITEIKGEKQYKEYGVVSIDLKRFRVLDIQAIGTSSEELMRFWRIFQKESGIKRNLKTRQKEMKIIGNEIDRLSSKNKSQGLRSSLKVGRNEPCPCGSGKKYKKCCLTN
jgi:hypothetical protein